MPPRSGAASVWVYALLFYRQCGLYIALLAVLVVVNVYVDASRAIGQFDAQAIVSSHSRFGNAVIPWPFLGWLY
jgi:hypothetical protein